VKACDDEEEDEGAGDGVEVAANGEYGVVPESSVGGSEVQRGEVQRGRETRHWRRRQRLVEVGARCEAAEVVEVDRRRAPERKSSSLTQERMELAAIGT